jgi:diacylglycerol kinase (ATP)
VTVSRIALVYNPESGRLRERKRAVDRFVQLLEEAGKSGEVLPTAAPRHAIDLAREAVAGGCDLVIAHGGDGTMNEVLQALVGTDVTLGFWPGGTANVLAAEIGFPRSVQGVVQRILAGQVKRVTVGKANDRYFLLMAGIGLDAAVAAGVDPIWKRRLGKGAFALSAIKFMMRWGLTPISVRVDGEDIEGRFVLAGNAHSYGGGFRLTPQADLSDPQIDLCIFQSGSRIQYLLYGFASLLGAHVKLPGVTYRKVRQALIAPGAGTGALMHLDGEVVGGMPVVIEAIPNALQLLV